MFDRNSAEKLLKAQEYADKAGRLNLVHSILNFIKTWGATFAAITGIFAAVSASKGDLQQADMVSYGIRAAVGGGVAVVGIAADDIVKAKADMYERTADDLLEEVKKDVGLAENEYDF